MVPCRKRTASVEEVAVFGKDGFQEAKALDQLNAFAEKAYRRPLTEEDKKPIRALYEKRIAEKPRHVRLRSMRSN
jgi:hypothetical protein